MLAIRYFLCLGFHLPNVGRIEDLMFNILVTGGAGYLGSVLVRKLIQKGNKVRVLDSLIFGDKGIKEWYGHPNFEFIHGSVQHLEDIVNAVHGMDILVDLAAIVGDPACVKNFNDALSTNFVSTIAQLELCKKFNIKHFIFASTCSVYGNSDKEIVDESSETNPLSYYAISKIDSERILLHNKSHQPKISILRLATLYGGSARMRFDLVVNTMSANAILTNKITVNARKLWRPLVHVEDAAEAFAKVTEMTPILEDHQIFNVGTNDQNYQIETIAQNISKLCPVCKIEYNPGNDDQRSYKVDFSKIEKTIKFGSKKRIKDGYTEIKSMIDQGIIKDISDPIYHNVKIPIRRLT
jgi:nucleoside-diphosphate-sugar epimerase